MEELKKIFLLFSQILDYPTDTLDDEIKECIQKLKKIDTTSTHFLQKFANNIEQVPLSRLQELYAQHIDFNPSCSLYIGYHLFGDSYKRSKFLVHLRDIYKKVNYVEKGSELPDSLPVIFQYFGLHSFDSEDSLLIIKESILPGLKKLQNTFKIAKNIYCDVIRALLNLFVKIDQEYSLITPKKGASCG